MHPSTEITISDLIKPTDIRVVSCFKKGRWVIEKHFYGNFIDYRITESPGTIFSDEELLELQELITSVIAYKYDK